jgi:hypothetical protein
MSMRTLRCLPLMITACAAEEAPTVSVPIVVSTAGLTAANTDLGYVVTVTRARLALRDLEMAVGGEAHAVAGPGARPDPAHPGHEAGGEVTGELAGRFVVDFSDRGAPIGDATLITGDYTSANFTFTRATAADGLAADDPLLGHTAHLEGVAAHNGQDYEFEAVIDLDEGTRVVGAPFPVTITEGASGRPIGLRLHTVDPYEADTLLDGIDFAALPEAQGLHTIAPGQEAHNVGARNLRVHDHYALDHETLDTRGDPP